MIQTTKVLKKCQPSKRMTTFLATITGKCRFSRKKARNALDKVALTIIFRATGPDHRTRHVLTPQRGGNGKTGKNEAHSIAI